MKKNAKSRTAATVWAVRYSMLFKNPAIIQWQMLDDRNRS